ncbi:MAG TPA: type I-MYXAN CRISPR-associated protein Cas6/Cmx6 [Thermoanaerobaculia bacterium]|jgi:CRISPR-associated protein Cas6|nr:MAG: CRISPR-associated endonuclease Cas6 [Acidobacteria bacterium ADurb.Bin051]HNU83566.1 type I-MYXAN CRISPR-associated protein Cas6/Cmx6 [Thermoanaerobaculia bacterium]
MEPVVDLEFALTGTTVVPIDHAHALYGALKAVVPALGDLQGLGVHTLRGRPDPPDLLLPKGARLRLRLPAAAIPVALELAGKVIRLHERTALVGVPQVFPLAPSSALWARMVTQRFQTVENDAARQQLLASFREEHREGEVTVGRARTIRIHGKQVLGFEMAIRGLGAEESIRLQSEGFGGRRAFGCGLFLPRRERNAKEAPVE